MKRALLLLLLGLSLPLQAQDIRLPQRDLQQELDTRLPLTHTEGLLAITLSEPQLQLLAAQQRLAIRTRLQVSTAFGTEHHGWISVDGKLRYEREHYSFYIDEPRIRDLTLDGLPPALQPQLQMLAQNLLTPALSGQAVYTLSDRTMQEALARMMLKSLRVEDDAVVARLGL